MCAGCFFSSQGIDVEVFEIDGYGNLGHQREDQKADGKDAHRDLDLGQ